MVDECDECLLVSDHSWNECIGCNGQPDDSDFDCTGTCGGHYAVNECGYCKDERHPGFADFGKDCNGGCNTTLKEDRCGQCIAESNQKWDDCVGCDNVANSGKAFNPCGYCLDSTMDDFDSYGVSCRYICETGWSWDECRECKAESDESRNECLVSCLCLHIAFVFLDIFRAIECDMDWLFRIWHMMIHMSPMMYHRIIPTTTSYRIRLIPSFTTNSRSTDLSALLSSSW